MFALIRDCFAWMPPLLFLLVSGVCGIFATVCFFQVIKLIADILGFLAQALGGIFGKILALFT